MNLNNTHPVGAVILLLKLNDTMDKKKVSMSLSSEVIEEVMLLQQKHDVDYGQLSSVLVWAEKNSFWGPFSDFICMVIHMQWLVQTLPLPITMLKRKETKEK